MRICGSFVYVEKRRLPVLLIIILRCKIISEAAGVLHENRYNHQEYNNIKC